ncbi:hypothetical protein SAVIM40S_07757 [Streptomyces avidinii]
MRIAPLKSACAPEAATSIWILTDSATSRHSSTTHRPLRPADHYRAQATLSPPQVVAGHEAHSVPSSRTVGLRPRHRSWSRRSSQATPSVSGRRHIRPPRATAGPVARPSRRSRACGPCSGVVICSATSAGTAMPMCRANAIADASVGSSAAVPRREPGRARRGPPRAPPAPAGTGAGGGAPRRRPPIPAPSGRTRTAELLSGTGVTNTSPAGAATPSAAPAGPRRQDLTLVDPPPSRRGSSANTTMSPSESPLLSGRRTAVHVGVDPLTPARSRHLNGDGKQWGQPRHSTKSGSVRSTSSVSIPAAARKARTSAGRCHSDGDAVVADSRRHPSSWGRWSAVGLAAMAASAAASASAPLQRAKRVASRAAPPRAPWWVPVPTALGAGACRRAPRIRSRLCLLEGRQRLR